MFNRSPVPGVPIVPPPVPSSQTQALPPFQVTLFVTLSVPIELPGATLPSDRGRPANGARTAERGAAGDGRGRCAN